VNQPSPRTGPPPWLHSLKPAFLNRTPPSTPPDPLRSAGQLLREAREAKGLSLRDLAQRTRISIAVLEALEGGWKDRLPEAAYLRAMLPLLEQQLELPAKSLESVLPHAARRERGDPSRAGSQAALFSPASLHLLTTWQSALAYGLLVLGLLYGVNLQQQRLAAQGRLSTNPIPLAPGQNSPQTMDAQAFPEVHPLTVAASGQAMERLARESKSSASPDHSLGLLTLSLSQPTALDLQSQRSGDTRLEGLEGEVSLPVLPPFELRLTPAPPPATVRWKGRTLAQKPLPPGEANQPPAEGPTAGVYGVPAP
jgi:cytoskeletal protein RodZ